MRDLLRNMQTSMFQKHHTRQLRAVKMFYNTIVSGAIERSAQLVYIRKPSDYILLEVLFWQHKIGIARLRTKATE
jgi:hypothetical protein